MPLSVGIFGEVNQWSKATAYGKVDGMNRYGRKSAATDWTNVGRFNATPANAAVPLADGQPEEWQFQARAVKRDAQIGRPSPVMTAIIPG